jgi:hypothetical protein
MDIKSYTSTDIKRHYQDHKEELQLKVLQGTAVSATTATAPNKQVKSESEKAFDNWTKGKRGKTAFPVLKDNNQYLTWNEDFLAEIRVQKMAKMTDKDYRIDQVTDKKAFDLENGNTLWQDATKLEMVQMDDYEVFNDMGLFNEIEIPIGFKKIGVHLVFAVKHDGRHKSRLVADGHLTDLPLESVYAGVVSIRGLRICILISELNDMTAYSTDIGNAYLTSKL